MRCHTYLCHATTVMKLFLQPLGLPPGDAHLLSFNHPILPPKTCPSSRFGIRFNIFHFFFLSLKGWQLFNNFISLLDSGEPRTCPTPHQHSPFVSRIHYKPCPPMCLRLHFRTLLLNAFPPPEALAYSNNACMFPALPASHACELSSLCLLPSLFHLHKLPRDFYVRHNFI